VVFLYANGTCSANLHRIGGGEFSPRKTTYHCQFFFSIRFSYLWSTYYLFKYVQHCSNGKTRSQHYSFTDYFKFPFQMENSYILIKCEDSEHPSDLLRTSPSEQTNEIWSPVYSEWFISRKPDQWTHTAHIHIHMHTHTQFKHFSCILEGWDVACSIWNLFINMDIQALAFVQ